MSFSKYRARGAADPVAYLRASSAGRPAHPSEMVTPRPGRTGPDRWHAADPPGQPAGWPAGRPARRLNMPLGGGRVEQEQRPAAAAVPALRPPCSRRLHESGARPAGTDVCRVLHTQLAAGGGARHTRLCAGGRPTPLASPDADQWVAAARRGRLQPGRDGRLQGAAPGGPPTADRLPTPAGTDGGMARGE